MAAPDPALSTEYRQLTRDTLKTRGLAELRACLVLRDPRSGPYIETRRQMESAVSVSGKRIKMAAPMAKRSGRIICPDNILGKPGGPLLCNSLAIQAKHHIPMAQGTVCGQTYFLYILPPAFRLPVLVAAP